MRPDLDAIRTKQVTRWLRHLNAAHDAEHAKTDGLLNDLDALLAYVKELETSLHDVLEVTE